VCSSDLATNRSS